MNKRTILLVALLLLGAGILAYPKVSNLINQRSGSYAIQQMQEQMESADLARQRELAEEYNAGIAAGEEPEGYDSILNFGSGMMGYLQIPKIGVNLPIYHGTDEETLAKGVGHMSQSAFPIGEEGNHAVLTGHTGLPSAELFTDLTELSQGDTFYIRILGQTLAYQVDQIKVVLPSEGQDLAAVPGEDYCTLVTCTPYGVNSHRLLVRGKRIEIPEEAADVQLQQELQKDIPVSMILGTVGLLALFVVTMLLIWKRIVQK